MVIWLVVHKITCLFWYRNQ